MTTAFERGYLRLQPVQNDENDEATEWEFRLTAPITVEIGYQGDFRR